MNFETKVVNFVNETFLGKDLSEDDTRGGGIKLGMTGKTKDGKSIKVLKKLSEGFLCSVDGKETEMLPGNMNKIRWDK